MENEVKKAEIFQYILERNYTCMFSLDILDEEGLSEFVQGFGGMKLKTPEDYEFWKNATENITGRRFSDARNSEVKAIVTPTKILGIGNKSGKYWLVLEDDKFVVKATRESIEKYFKENNIRDMEENIIDREEREK